MNNQAIFVLKGKPLNVWDLKRDVIYKNDEMYNLMRALNVEDNLEGLRYDKVILATDADVDGMHIRNLLITYFFRFFEQLVHDGHLLRAGDAALPRAQQGADDSTATPKPSATTALDGTRRQARRSRGSRAWAKSARANSRQFIGKEMRLEPGRIRAENLHAADRSSTSTWARTRPSGRITSWTIWWSSPTRSWRRK